MKKQERVDAAEALMRWFASQEIGEGDAADIMTIVLAAMIDIVAQGDRKKQNEGSELLMLGLKIVWDHARKERVWDQTE